MDFMFMSCDSFCEGKQEMEVIIDRNYDRQIRGIEVFFPLKVLGSIFADYLTYENEVNDQCEKGIKYSADVDMLYIKKPNVTGKSIYQEAVLAKPLLNPIGRLIGIRVFFNN
jgi:uncharacterized protein YuzE